MAIRKTSNTSKAIAWMLADPSRTQVAAANEFGISQSGISSVKMREDFAIEYCRSVPELTEMAVRELGSDPMRTHRGLMHLLKISEGEAKRLILGIRAQTTRNEALRNLPAKVDPVAAMREQCAMLAEAIGGEYGAHVAAAIRGLV